MRAAEGNVVFAEVPLLFEGGYEGQFDEVIVVLRPTEERISALAARDGMSRREALFPACKISSIMKKIR